MCLDLKNEINNVFRSQKWKKQIMSFDHRSERKKGNLGKNVKNTMKEESKKDEGMNEFISTLEVK